MREAPIVSKQSHKLSRPEKLASIFDECATIPGFACALEADRQARFQGRRS